MIRVLVDTNVVISALLFPNSTPARALALVLDEHRLVLTDWIIDELHEVVRRKRPDLLGALDAFLDGIDYELASPGEPGVPISDPDDQPILDAAVASAVDVIVTGDKAFPSVGPDRPRFLTARDLLDWSANWVSPRTVEWSTLRRSAMTRTYRKFDDDFKAGAVQLVAQTGKPIAQVARDLGINEGTLGNWVAKARQAEAGGSTELTADERAELARLRKDVVELRMQRDVLKRSVALWVDEAMGR